MNVLALGLLIFASLVTSAAVLSPTREKRNSGEDVIVKEGHRVVVVEFGKDAGNTKISILPHAILHDQVDRENAKEKLSGTSMENSREKLMKENGVRRGLSPKELVCDAYGKCKPKIECAMGKAKEGVAGKVHEAEDMSYEVEEEAREEASEAVCKVKDASHKAYDKAREAAEGTKDAASETTSKAKDMLGEKAGGGKEGAQETVENASKRAEKGAREVKEEGKKELSDISRRAREVAFDMFEYAMPPLSMAFIALHLLGFAVAYGTCVWVTFALSYVLASALPRNQFGLVQSKIYPVYFKAMAYSVGMALLGHLMSIQTNAKGVGIFQASNLMMSIVMILVNLLYLQPRATKVVLGRMKEEEKEGGGGVKGTAGRSVTRKSEMLNSTSSFLNFMTLMSLTCHLLHLGRRMHAATTC
ncbi:uncharacterized protein [Primulina huaijiensis]|uniref:uncharacterized protein n=1 Tax=Primulina huaijiensis TaxID=1492673 RepID=UPI003CC77B44